VAKQPKREAVESGLNETFLSPYKVERKALIFGLSEGSVTAVGVPGRVRDLAGERPVMSSKAFFACTVREHVSCFI
jgi:hypothetical protein